MSLGNGMRRAALAGLAAAWLAAPAAADGVHARLQTIDPVVDPNEEFDVEFAIFQADHVFNGFDLAIRFDPTRLTYVAGTNAQGAVMTSACANRFHLFGAAPDSLRTTLVLLCAGVSVTGPGVLYKARFKAGTTVGGTMLEIGPSTQFFDAGFDVEPLEAQNLQICITTCPVGVEDDAAVTRFAMRAPSPNPWSGRGPASFGFDLPRAGEVSLTLHDVGGRVVASTAPRWFEPGRHVLALERPQGARAGVYFARMRSPFGSVSRAVVLAR